MATSTYTVAPPGEIRDSPAPVLAVPDDPSRLFGGLRRADFVGPAAASLDLSSHWTADEWQHWTAQVANAAPVDVSSLDPRVRVPSKADYLSENPRGEVLAGGLLHHGLGTREGQTWRIEVAPGVLTWRRVDLVRAQLSQERQREAAILDTILRPETDNETGGRGRGKVAGWSRKSRSNMVKQIGRLDFGPLLEQGAPAVLTLTYPSKWLDVAPSARKCSAHINAFRSAFRRKWGRAIVGVWKREFQRRGAPHYHILMVPPAGREFDRWVALTWARIVGAECCGGEAPAWPEHAAVGMPADCCERHRHIAAHQSPKVVDRREGSRYTDPVRVGVYFSKHGMFAAKDYQNHAPKEWQLTPDGEVSSEGVGRFWGVWGLAKATAETVVEPVVYEATMRTARRWQQSRLRGGKVETYAGIDGQVHRRVTGVPATAPRRVARGAERLDETTGELVQPKRSQNRRIRPNLGGRAGFLLVNDAPALAMDLGRYASLIVSWSASADSVRLDPRRLP